MEDVDDEESGEDDEDDDDDEGTATCASAPCFTDQRPPKRVERR
jgi:hypothetical protein